MALDMSKFIKRFVAEAREHIENINKGIAALEQGDNDAERINSVFRSAHTIKGTSRMLKLTTISEMAHGMENIFGLLREGRMTVDTEVAELLYRGIDWIADQVEAAATGSPLASIDESLTRRLAEVFEQINARPSHQPSAQPTTEKPDRDRPPEVLPPEETVKNEERPGSPAAPSVAQSPEVEKIDAPDAQRIPDAFDQSDTHNKEPARSSEDGPKPAPSEGPKGPPPPRTKGKGGESTETIRLDASQLDELIKIGGGMITFRSRIKARLSGLAQAVSLAQHIHTDLDGTFTAMVSDRAGSVRHEQIQQKARELAEMLDRVRALLVEDADRLDLLTMELQDRSLKLRMLPLSSLFETFPRLVRDAARALKKKVRLNIQGGDTELDRYIIETIGDPLVHMLRNSLDHGMETPENRILAGKPDTGTVTLRAWPQGNSVVIELSDDGPGIAVARLKEKALQKGLMKAEELESRPRSEILKLIFHPGLSTSQIITDFSGRGVGMDVVHKNIVDVLGGAIEVESEEGRGTRFTLRLPLSMATLRVLQFEVAQRPYAMSSGSILEVARFEAGDVIQVVGRRAIRLRHQVVPVIRLAELLELPARPWEDMVRLDILIVSNGIETLGLVVDRILDEDVMVLKPMPQIMQDNPLVTGAMISGNNQIVMVLDSATIVQMAKRLHQSRLPVGRSLASRLGDETRRRILVVDDSMNTRELEKDILESKDYHVSLAKDGQEGLDMASQFPFDLIVTDVEMPRMDGFSLTEKLRSMDMHRYTPIVIVTSRDREEDKQRGIRVGANAYIVKGAFDEFSLLDTVQSLLEFGE
ncbi:MAG: hybrid sensor histidine kinase/response regulator [Magnetococcales bacterium]|nr:hybrid sensor histidine kinase/response regulator [Magnetococcales bacterium]